jgi:hypothetical protein
MATNEKGILGGFSGKVGTVIGGNWNGVDYMRGKPGEIINPQTEAQQNQRAKVAAIVRYLRPLTPVLRTGFKKQAHKMSAFNAAVSYNLTHAATGTSSYFEMDYSKILISHGKLAPALDPGVSSPGTGLVEFSWKDNSSDKGALPDDRALLVVYRLENAKVVTVMEGSFRAGGKKILTLPPDFQGSEVHCYIAFQDARQTMISDSCYAGTTVVK